MKNLKKLLALFGAAVMALTMLGGCLSTNDKNGDKGDQNQTDNNGGETPVEPALPEPPEASYTYKPHVSAEMPRVDIATVTNSNDFAIWPNRDNKAEWVYTDCTVTVSNCDEAYELSATGGVKVRGNYTANYDKKPLRLKFDKKQQMLGLNGGAKCKSWVLLADYKDASMIRNSTAFYLGNMLLGSEGYYTSDYRDVEVYLNGEYWGVYLLCEQQQTNENRIDITEPADDYAGTDIGYLVEYDGYYNEEERICQVVLNYNNYAPVKKCDGSNIYGWQSGYTVKSDIYSSAQNAFISSYLENVYRICYNAIYKGTYQTFNDSYTALVSSSAQSVEECIGAVIDIDSLVSTYILQEIACDYDINWSSFLMDVDFGADGDKILRFEAPWDFDSALGNRPVCESGMGLYAATSENPWLVMFATQSWFNDKVKAKWRDAAENGVFDGALEQIDTLTQTYASYYAKNNQKWGVTTSNDAVSGELCYAAVSCKTQKEAAAYLKTWLSNRFTYLEAVWGKASDVASGPEQGATAYRFEAENCVLTGGIQVKTGNGASGDGYLGNVSGGVGKTISFTVNVQSDAAAFLSIGLSKREYEALLGGWFSLTVNGETVVVPARMVPAGDGSWHDWTEVYMAAVQLKAGANTVVVATVSSDTTNVDYFNVYCKTPVN